MDGFMRGYAECALWASPGDDECETLDAFTFDDLAPCALETMRQDCEAFQAANAADLEGIDPEQAGHDFFLTRNGHGTGFWDRGLGERGKRLSDACRQYGEAFLYVGDDGWVYHL